MSASHYQIPYHTAKTISKIGLPRSRRASGTPVVSAHAEWRVKRKVHHVEDFFISGCTWGCRDDNSQCIQWRKSRHVIKLCVLVINTSIVQRTIAVISVHKKKSYHRFVLRLDSMPISYLQKYSAKLFQLKSPTLVTWVFPSGFILGIVTSSLIGLSSQRYRSMTCTRCVLSPSV